MLPGARKDQASTPIEWDQRRDLIAGVRVKQGRNIVTRNGVTTEMFRLDWGVGRGPLEHAIHVSLRAGALSAWHCHEEQTDHIFVTHGAIKLVLFDDRESSATRGQVNEFHLSLASPMLVVFPPGIWHGLQNLMPDTSVLVNMFERAYNYGDPDEWRLPPDTAAIPYRF